MIGDNTYDLAHSKPTTLQERVHANAVAHGFYEDYKRIMALMITDEDRTFLRQIWISHRLMLIVSELAEGLEAVRDQNFSTEPKSNGLGEELADANIRLLDLFEHLFGSIANGHTGKFLEQVSMNKAAYNETRPHKHNRSL